MYYFDSAYVAKCYLNDPDSDQVRDLVRSPAPLYSSVVCIPEVGCAIHRRVREKSLSRPQSIELASLFRADVESGVWALAALGGYERLRTLPASVFLRARDKRPAHAPGGFVFWPDGKIGLSRLWEPG